MPPIETIAWLQDHGYEPRLQPRECGGNAVIIHHPSGRLDGLPLAMLVRVNAQRAAIVAILEEAAYLGDSDRDLRLFSGVILALAHEHPGIRRFAAQAAEAMPGLRPYTTGRRGRQTGGTR